MERTNYSLLNSSSSIQSAGSLRVSEYSLPSQWAAHTRVHVPGPSVCVLLRLPPLTIVLVLLVMVVLVVAAIAVTASAAGGGPSDGCSVLDTCCCWRISLHSVLLLENALPAAISEWALCLLI